MGQYIAIYGYIGIVSIPRRFICRFFDVHIVSVMKKGNFWIFYNISRLFNNYMSKTEYLIWKCYIWKFATLLLVREPEVDGLILRQ